ncbi:MAG: hypothetical protein ACERKD_02250 [Prolixibacteraceae bacterium]
MKNLKKKIKMNDNLLNVKPKNLNVMKRNLFKLMMIVGLMVLANTTFAAAGDKWNPYSGSTHTYTIVAVTGDTYDLFVTDNSATAPTLTTQAVAVTGNADFSNVAANATNVALMTQTVAANLISEEIVWDDDAASGDYFLWVRTESTDGCSNWRYKKVTIINYIVDFVAYAYGENSAFTGGPTAGNTTAEECQDPLAFTYDADAADDGDVVMYFKVSRIPTNTVDLSWGFTAALSSSVPAAIASASYTWGYTSTATGEGTDLSSFSALTLGENDVYIKVTIPAYTAADFTATLTISAGADVNGKSDDEAANATVLAANSAVNSFFHLPAIGAFN